MHLITTCKWSLTYLTDWSNNKVMSKLDASFPVIDIQRIRFSRSLTMIHCIGKSGARSKSLHNDHSESKDIGLSLIFAVILYSNFEQ